MGSARSVATLLVEVLASLTYQVGQVSTCAFSKDELRDLFTFQEGTDSDTHKLLRCSCRGQGLPQEEGEARVDAGGSERSCQLGRQQEKVKESKDGMAELFKWAHFSSPIEDKVDDPWLQYSADFISYMFVNQYEESSS